MRSPPHIHQRRGLFVHQVPQQRFQPSRAGCRVVGRRLRDAVEIVLQASVLRIGAATIAAPRRLAVISQRSSIVLPDRPGPTANHTFGLSVSSMPATDFATSAENVGQAGTSKAFGQGRPVCTQVYKRPRSSAAAAFVLRGAPAYRSLRTELSLRRRTPRAFRRSAGQRGSTGH